MDRKLQGLFGLINDAKYEYRIESREEISGEEYQYCQIITDYLWDEHLGVTKTLGPTWDMIHDPRFREIEYSFVQNRRALFGGDARLGRQFITEEGVVFASTTAGLEQYAEILENGRHFHEVVKREGYNPKQFYTQPDVTIWQFVKQECPNYFGKEGHPNQLAQIIVACIKRDLLGLIDDYAEVANVQEWVSLETGLIVEDVQSHMVTEHNPIVWQEVDLLEKALTFRTLLRVTAARILDHLEITKWIGDNKWNLTEFERDQVLQLVYNSGYKWPDDKTNILLAVVNYLQAVNSTDWMQREATQLQNATAVAQERIAALKSGAAKPITRYTEPQVEIEMDAHAVLVNEILTNPLKKDLFMIYQAAEEDNDQDVVKILAPVFEAPGYVISEEVFREFVRRISEVAKPLEVNKNEGDTYDIYNKAVQPVVEQVVPSQDNGLGYPESQRNPADYDENGYRKIN